MSAWDRLKEYPMQHFAVVNGKLRCDACSEVLADKKSSIERHTKSKKHEKGLADIQRNKSEQQSIKECLQKRAKRENASRSTLPSDIQLYRYELLELLCWEEWLYRKLMPCVPFLKNMVTG